MLKTILTFIFSLICFLCFAQKQLLSYHDLQIIIQSKPEQATSFLQQKDYHLQPAFTNKQIRFLTLYADNDYTDISIVSKSKHNTVLITTTHLAQAEEIQKALQAYQFKDNKGTKVYHVKDDAVSNISFKEEQKSDVVKIYSIELEN